MNYVRSRDAQKQLVRTPLSGTTKDVSERDVSGKTRKQNHRSLGETTDSKVMAWLNGLKTRQSCLTKNNAMELQRLEPRLPDLKFEAPRTFSLARLHKHQSTATFTLFSESSVVACSVTSSLISLFTGSFAC